MKQPIFRVLSAFLVVVWATAAAALTPSNSPANLPLNSPPKLLAKPPQVLGLIATKTPVPLRCENGVCTGFFSAFCLQEHRPPPTAGQVYELAGTGTVSLVVTRADGRQQVLSATGLLDYASIDGYTAVKISLPKARLAALDGDMVAVDVSRQVALVPRLQADQSDAFVAADADTARGPKRLMAEGFFENNTPQAAAAYTMSRLINLLPVNGPVASQQRQGLWQKIKSSGVLEGVNPQGQRRAKEQLQRCNSFADQGLAMRMRGCIANAHNRLLKAVNQRFWDSTDGF